MRRHPRRRRLFTAKRDILRREHVAGAPVGEESRGSYRGVASERQFALRRKDPYARRIDRVPRLEHEYGLGQVEFGGDRLHAGIVETVSVKYDREGIASKRRLGEHIERLKPARHKMKVPRPTALLDRPNAPRQYQENRGASKPGDETMINGRYDSGSD